MKFLNVPIIIREHKIPSRCFLAPINTGYAERGNPTTRLINFHRTRSGEGIGISFVGTTAISRDTVTNENSLVLDNHSDLNSFKNLSDSIRKNGSLPGMQLGCRLTKMVSKRTWTSRSVEKKLENIRRELSSYSKSNFIKVSENFYRSIALAVKTEYEVVQLHAAHGYFLSLLLSPILNKRKDEYGFPNLKLIFDVVEKAKQSFPNIILSVRMNCIYGLEDKKKELERTAEIVTRLFEVGVDIIDFSAGIYDINKYLIYPSVSDGHACYLNFALQVQRRMRNNKSIISFAGNVWDLNKVDKNLEKNMAVSIGRSLIADSQFVLKYFENRIDEIIPCKREKICPCHYFSNGRPYIECSENKNLMQKM